MRSPGRLRFSWALLLICHLWLDATATAPAGEAPAETLAWTSADDHSHTTAEETSLRRWAVIAIGSLRQDGLGDLLTTELSKVKGLELVERERLDAAIGELELSSLSAADRGSARLKLGQLLKADALAVLSLEQRDGKAVLRLVIAETRFGARLRVARWPYAPAAPQEACRRVAAAISESQRRFAGGVRQLIGVTHLVSKNLSHQYDHLQAGYAYLIENALAATPGVAVLETEEAQSLRRELELAGADVQGRIVPVLVSGEYEMQATDAPDRPKIDLAVRIVAGNRTVTPLERRGLAPREAVDFLAREVPAAVVRAAGQSAAVPLSAREQCKLLADRAAEFSALGAWKEAVGLRHAAILLAPDDVELRLAMLADCRHWSPMNFEDERRVLRGSSKGGPDQWRKENAVAWDQVRTLKYRRWLSLAAQSEDIVRSRALNPAEAGLLMAEVLREAWDVRLPQELMHLKVKQRCDRFVWSLIPMFGKLDSGIGQGRLRPAVLACVHQTPLDRRVEHVTFTPRQQYFQWTAAACGYLAQSALRENVGCTYSAYGCYLHVRPNTPYFDDPKRLDGLYRFLNEAATPEMPPIPFMAAIVARPPQVAVLWNQKRFSEDEIRGFYARLRESGKPLNAFYARCGLLMLEASRTVEAEKAKKLSAEAEELMNFLDQHGYSDRDPAHLGGPGSAFCAQLGRLRDDLLKRSQSENSDRRKSHRRPHDWAVANQDMTARLKFEPIVEVPVPTLPLPEWKLAKCSEEMDVLWSDRHVDVMRKKGVLHTIFRIRPDSPTAIGPVVFDGRDFWIGTSDAGVYVVSPDGKHGDHVTTAEGLPPYNAWAHAGAGSLGLYALGPGRCMAIGAYGPTRRIWLSAIQREAGAGDKPTYRVNVFHKAIRLPGGTSDPTQHPAEDIFRLSWMKAWASPDAPERSLVLINRPEMAQALVVDPTTLRVSVASAALPLRSVSENGEGEVFDRGRWFQAMPSKVELYLPPAAGAKEWTRKQLAELHVNNLPPMLLRDGKSYYVPGYRWCRIDPDREECEPLNAALLPAPYVFLHYGVSAHYGLIAWQTEDLFRKAPIRLPDCLFRVIVDEQGPDATNPNVPAEQRQQHQRAVDALRKAGAEVDAANLSPEVGTRVMLGKKWKGSNADLALLRDLHNLRALYLLEVPVNDQSLQRLGELESLRSLFLIETKVTDQGLAALSKFPALNELWLEGSIDGREFTDRGLEHLKDMAKMKSLTLYGKGFTDAALPVLKALPNLRKLETYDTAITKDAEPPARP